MLFKAKAYFLIGFFCFSSVLVFGQQDQKLADSLILQYNSGLFGGDELGLLAKIVEAETNPDTYLEFSDLLINRAAKDSSYHFLYTGYLQKGNALRLKGNNVEALTSFFKSLTYANRINNDTGIGSLMISIADTYSDIGNSDNAQTYYNRGIALLRKINDSIKVATALLNAGDNYFNSSKLDSAVIYTNESVAIFEQISYPIGQAYGLGNLGMVYAQQGKDTIAEQHILKAIDLLEQLEDYYPVSVYLTYMADIYTKRQNFETALKYAQKSLELATAYRLKDQISDANLKLAQLYEPVDQAMAYKHYKDYITYRDSVINIENVQQIADIRTNYEVSQKQIEVDLLEQKRKNQRMVVIATVAALVLIGLLAILLYRRYVFIRKTKQIIEEERDRSDRLLLNILPEETAAELKQNGAVKAKKYEAVTVLFSDFKGFTAYSEKLSPERLVETVGFYFSRFDEIMEKYGLEKIKTIGDAYMCAGGLQQQTADHAHRMVSAALEIVQFVEETKNDVAANELSFDIRIGINTGPVVAGVVGSKKFAYDIWGDTVNVAARMETLSEPGKINISESTYDLIKDQWNCAYRGEIEVKNRGALKMYFVGQLSAVPGLV